MGGLESEVGETTTDVLLEAANFEPIGILRSSERLGLRSEASNRWEKGVDPYVAEQAAVFATPAHRRARRRALHRARRRSRRASRAARHPSATAADGIALVGLPIPADEQRAILERLGFDVRRRLDGHGPDLARPRRHSRGRPDRGGRARPRPREGAVHAARSGGRCSGASRQDQRLRRLVEDVMVGCGFSEAYTWSLAEPGRRPERAAAARPALGRARDPADEPRRRV